MEWFADKKFYPIPGWPDSWRYYVTEENGFRLFDTNGNDGFKLNGHN
jgi:hypothetical protein